jgi:hypothetical protein
MFNLALHRRTFLELIRALPNQSLWENFVVDRDGSWIYDDLLTNLLVMMNDGLYDEMAAKDVCSCAAMIKHSVTGQRASVSWVEKSDRFSADNYRDEILGGIALQLILRAACDGKYKPFDEAIIVTGVSWQPPLAPAAGNSGPSRHS